MSILTLILILLLSFICIKISNKFNSFFHPISIFVYLWIVLIFISILIFRNYKWDGSGLIWILLYLLFMELGALLVDKKITKNESKDKADDNRTNNELKKKKNWCILLFVIILGFTCFVLQVKSSGFSLSSFTDFDSYLDMNTTVAYNRYYGSQQTDMITQLLLVFVYLSTLAGGYSYNFAEKKINKFISSIGSFIPVLGCMLFSNAKSGFISGIFLWLTGYCVSYIVINKKLPSLKIKNIIYGLIGLLIVFVLLFIIMLVRTGQFSSNMQNTIFNKFLVYGFGNVVNFDYWFSLGNSISIEFGINTYMALFKTFGLANRIQGVYTTILPGYGNVFSSFRGIIMDFGIVGGLLFAFFRGFFIQYIINNIKYNKPKCIYVTLLASLCFFNLYSIIISPWIYTSYFLMIPLFFLYLLFFHKLLKIRGVKNE